MHDTVCTWKLTWLFLGYPLPSYVCHPTMFQLRHYHATPAARMVVGGARSAASSAGDVTSKYQISECMKRATLGRQHWYDAAGLQLLAAVYICTYEKCNTCILVPCRTDTEPIRVSLHLSYLWCSQDLCGTDPNQETMP